MLLTDLSRVARDNGFSTTIRTGTLDDLRQTLAALNNLACLLVHENRSLDDAAGVSFVYSYAFTDRGTPLERRQQQTPVKTIAWRDERIAFRDKVAHGGGGQYTPRFGEVYLSARMAGCSAAGT